MVSISKVIRNAQGLHARPAANFVSVAKGFKSKINIEKDGKKVNAKSLLAILGAGIVKDSEVVIYCEGEDEEEAAAALGEFIENGCGEA